ncbi:MAG TPA: manganese transporter permease [Devosia sp.]|nr:manganese transporter permease [Devosia sp.]
MSGPPTHPAAGQSLMRRLWLYQAERFPLGKTAILLAVFSGAGLSVSAHLAGRALPGLWTFIGVWLVVVILFFQMRAADEFKDLEDDSRYRPGRPIPSGLVSLKLILGLAGAGALVALGLVASVHLLLIVFLLMVWLWLCLMSAEFFVPEWLKAHPVVYLVSHMVIMVFITLFITAAEWLPHGAPPQGLWLFLTLGFVNGLVLEVGRKVWAPASEREGVETYSALLGPSRAAIAWAGTGFVAWMLLLGVGLGLGLPLLVGIPGFVAFALLAGAAVAFARNPTQKGQKLIDRLSGLWVLVCYMLVGLTPLLAGGAGT